MPAQVAGVPVEPRLGSGGNTHAVTSGSNGASYVYYPAQVCCQLTIGNHSGTDVECQQDGIGDGFPVFNNTYFTFYGITDASRIGVRRFDQTASPVSVAARWEA